MNPIELKLNDHKRGGFVIEENGEVLAEMAIALIGKNLVVYHTEVSETLRGKGIAGDLLNTMTDYARTHDLKVVPLCQYVHQQFTRDPAKYADIWNKEWHQ